MLRSADSDSAAAPDPATPDPERSAALLRIAGGLAGLLLALVTFAPPSASRILGWPLAGAAFALWVFPVAVGLGAIARGVSWRLPPALILAGLTLLVFSAFASALASPFSAASLPRLWPTLGGAALYLWLHHAWSGGPDRGETKRRLASTVLAGAGALFAALSLYQWSGGAWPLPWGGRNAAPFGHSTYTGGAVVLLLPWLVRQHWVARGVARFAWALGALASLVVLASTSSRGAVLGLAFVAAIGTAGIVVAARWPWPRKLALVAGLAFVGAAAVFTNPRLRDLVVHRQWSESARESNRQRQAMLVAGLQLGLERPLLGWGPGTVPLAYPRVRARLDGGTENILQLHNTPAQLWATTGLVGTMASLLLAAGTLAALVRAPRNSVTFAASASLLGYGIVALTDHQLDLPALNALTAAALALLTSSLAAGGATYPPSRFGRALLGVPLAALVFLAGRAAVGDLRARWCYDDALTALGRNDASGYLQALDRATAATPHDPFFAHRAAVALLDQRTATPDRTRQAALARDAAARLQRSLLTGAHEEFAHFNLGWLHLDLGQPADAARHFAAAARLVPDKGGVYFGLGLAHATAGQTASATRAFALELLNDPRSLTSPAWEVPALAALLPAARAEALRLGAGIAKEFPVAAETFTWVRWWWGEPVSAGQLRPGFNAESARFLQSLPAINAREPLAPAGSTAGSLWAKIYEAWRNAPTSPAPGAPGPFLALAGNDAACATALARRAAPTPPDFRAFLTAPTGDEAALVRLSRRQRPGYGVLALHPEGPPLTDLFVVQENRATDFAADLIPLKGWLPGRFLLALLPDDPR